MHLRFFLISALLCTALWAAEDGPSMQSFCRTLLGVPQEANLSNATNQTTQNETFQLANFSFSTQHYSAKGELDAANESVERLASMGMPNLRSRDLYMVAHQWLEGQAALELTGQQGNYDFVLQKASEILSIEQRALEANDELKALSFRLGGVSPDVNSSEALALQSEARREFADGRFEEAKSLATTAYDRISSAEAEALRKQALLESARHTIETFLEDNWQTIAATAVATAILIFIFQKQIRRFTVNSRISALTAERAVLLGMIKSLQSDYFDSGKVNELSYHIKTKKFGDMIRNINRRIPLLKEELKKI